MLHIDTNCGTETKTWKKVEEEIIKREWKIYKNEE